MFSSWPLSLPLSHFLDHWSSVCSFLWNSFLGFCLSLFPDFSSTLLLIYELPLWLPVLTVVGRIGLPPPHFSSYYISFILWPHSFSWLQYSPCYWLSSLYHQFKPHPQIPNIYAPKLPKFFYLYIPKIEPIQIYHIQNLSHCQFFECHLPFSLFQVKALPS